MEASKQVRTFRLKVEVTCKVTAIQWMHDDYRQKDIGRQENLFGFSTVMQISRIQ